LEAYLGAFRLFAGATAAVAVGQFSASVIAPYVSIGLSAGAVALTVVALVLPPRP
jgi:hypothetical protein